MSEIDNYRRVLSDWAEFERRHKKPDEWVDVVLETGAVIKIEMRASSPQAVRMRVLDRVRAFATAELMHEEQEALARARAEADAFLAANAPPAAPARPNGEHEAERLAAELERLSEKGG